MLDFGEVLDKTRILDTEEFVISEGFRKEILRWFEGMLTHPKNQASPSQAIKDLMRKAVEKEGIVMNEKKNRHYNPETHEFSPEVREQVRDELHWLCCFLREKFGLTIPETKRLTEEMLTVSI